MNYSELDNIGYEQLQAYIFSGRNNDLPEPLVKYLEVLELVRSMYDKYKTKHAIVRLLSLAPYNLSEYKAQKIYCQALNFFYSDNDVKKKAWANITAEKLDKLALLAIANDDYECARRCFADAAKLRMDSDNEQAIPKELLDRRPIFYTIRPKDVGLPEPNRKKLKEFIDALPDIPTDHRLMLHRDGRTESQEGNVFDLNPADIEFMQP